ncbi:MAG TPA: NUDIX domain-containing protein [Chromatiales bacterium]|nr:NUDIX domain-containing protein [Chromatiales bacterium]
MGPQDFEVVARETCHDGFFRLERYVVRHRLFRGGWSPPLTRELLERGHAAAVLPYDARRDRLLLVEQFRIGAVHDPAGPWLIETVAGMIEPGEDPVEVVRREAREEAGCELGELVEIGTYYVTPGGASERIHLYCARADLEGVGGVHGLQDEGEDIRVLTPTFEEAWAMLGGGRIRVATPLIALQWLALHRERLRREWGAAP